MQLIKELRKNDGQITIEDFIDFMEPYERVFKYLAKNKEYGFLFKIIKPIIDDYRNETQYPLVSYRPGMDYIVPYYTMYLYATMMENGIKGVVKKNKDESTYAYLTLLKRIDKVPSYMRGKLLKKSHLLLRHAYPDLMDLYSVALNYVGEYYFKKRDYKLAFKFFKKGADFNCDGRQIVYPYYLIGINQDRVGDMYRYGFGVEKNQKLAIKYYEKCAENCGRKHHPKTGDFLLKNKRYSEAFLYYTEVNARFRYYTGFLEPKHLGKKFDKIFEGINKIPDAKKTKLDWTVLAMMYHSGLGCEKDENKYRELIPNDAKWAEEWMDKFI